MRCRIFGQADWWSGPDEPLRYTWKECAEKVQHKKENAHLALLVDHPIEAKDRFCGKRNYVVDVVVDWDHDLHDIRGPLSSWAAVEEDGGRDGDGVMEDGGGG